MRMRKLDLKIERIAREIAKIAGPEMRYALVKIIMSSMGAKLKTIAERSGVAYSTMRNAFSQGRMGEETAIRILNYLIRTNTFAVRRALKVLIKEFEERMNEMDKMLQEVEKEIIEGK